MVRGDRLFRLTAVGGDALQNVAALHPQARVTDVQIGGVFAGAAAGVHHVVIAEGGSLPGRQRVMHCSKSHMALKSRHSEYPKGPRMVLKAPSKPCWEMMGCAVLVPKISDVPMLAKTLLSSSPGRRQKGRLRVVAGDGNDLQRPAYLRRNSLRQRVEAPAALHQRGAGSS